MALLVVVLIVLAVGIVLWIAGIYNSLVSHRHRYQNAYAQIDVQLKRRYDLIPNLVETAKGYMKHERETLEAVIAARNAAATANSRAATKPGDREAMRELVGAEASLTGSLGRLFALSEGYPDLKANQNMLRLQEELTSTENRVAYARQAFNDAVMTYNIVREKFPNTLLSGTFGFEPASSLDVIERPVEREAPRVSF
jgi:LemA protein